MAKPRLYELPQQKGEFLLKGKIVGVKKTNFFKEGLSKKGNPYRSMSFEVQTDNESRVQVEMFESMPNEVFFYKKFEEEVDGKKGVTERVPYSIAKTFNQPGFNAIGMTNGLETHEVPNKDTGVMETKNKMVSMNNYDALEYLKEHLKDGLPVVVMGEIKYRTSEYKGEIQRSITLSANKIINSTVDFESQDFEKKSHFKQSIVLTGTEIDDTDANDKKGVLQGLVVGYSTIEHVELLIRDQKLFKHLKTKVKPYTAMNMNGVVFTKIEADEEDEEDNIWGTTSFDAKPKFKRQIRELIVTGVDPESFDVDTYNKRELEKAFNAIEESKRAKEEFGEKETVSEEVSWGTKGTVEEEESWD